MPMRITHSKNATSSKSYFELSDYLEADPNQLLKGQWFGKGAAMLGLEGTVQKEHFDRLIDNQMPFEDKRLTQRQRADRRVGTDLTFSAPKSVSLLWAATQDDELLKAVQAAADETLTDLEQDAQTRINVSRGVMDLAKTRNIVGASWLHTTSRPVDGYPDPNLHVHCFTINASKANDRWTALDLSAVVKDSGYYEAVFQSRLAQKVQSLGYPIARSARDFEIEGIERSTIDKFSRRMALIEQEAELRGITDAARKGQLGAQTRDKKSASLIEPGDLHNKWLSLLSSEERSALRKRDPMSLESQGDKLTAAQTIDHAVKHSFERDSVVRERQLLRRAILRGIGEVTVEQAHAEAASRPWLREGTEDKTLVSTREVLAEEQSLIAFAKRVKGELPALAPDHQIKRTWLSEEQKKAVLGLLQSHDGISIARGVAGSGKTTLMSEAIEAIESHGKHVTVLAPSADAAHGVLRDQEGFNAETLARFLVDERMQHEAVDGVIWVDEGALVGTRDLVRLADVAKAIDARFILSGDSKQHQPVAAGSPFQLLEAEAGIKPFEVQTIRRQEKEGYRKAVESLSRGEATEGMAKLVELGFVTEIDDDDDRHRRLAADYADSIDSGNSTLVIAPTHAEREIVNEAIRKELKYRNKIIGKEHTIETLQSKRLTEAERADAHSYVAGDVIEFVTKGKGGFKAGERLTVVESGKAKVTASTDRGTVDVPLDSPKSFDVYRRVDRRFAKGDVVRITKNRQANKTTGDKRLNNGSLATLKGFTNNGDLKLSNGQTISKSWSHIDHGAVVTSYASQGKTFDRVLVAQGSLSFPASSPEQLYVSASRARKGMMIYTDHKEELLAAVSNHRPTKNATDLVVEPRVTRPAIKENTLVSQAERLRISATQFATHQLQLLKQWVAQAQQQREAAR